MLKPVLCSVIVAASLTAAAPANADTILYSTLSEGDAFGSSRFWQAHDFDPEQGGELQVSLAMPFTITDPSGVVVRSIELGLEFDPTGEDFVEADLYSAVNGAPGSLITIAGYHDLPFFSTPDRLLPIPTHLELAPGDYFLSIFSTGDIRTVWWQTTAPVFGGSKSVNGGPWTSYPDVPRGAFRLIGHSAPPSPVPEPSSLLLLSSALVGAWTARRGSAERRWVRFLNAFEYGQPQSFQHLQKPRPDPPGRDPDDDEAPETPTDEPPPLPVEDPPDAPGRREPYVVRA